MGEYEFTVSDDKVTAEARVDGDAAKAVALPSDATFTVGTGTISETVTTDHGTLTLDFTQDASNPQIYDLSNTSWSGSGQSGQSGGHHWTGLGGWTGDGSGQSASGGHGLGASDPGGPLQPASASASANPGGPTEPAGGSGPTSTHAFGPTEVPSTGVPSIGVPSLETQIAQLHATGGSLF